MRWRCAFALACELGLSACSGSILDAHGSSPPAADGGSTGPDVVADAGGQAGSDAPYVASESLARRLSRAELDNTLRDLLADDSAPASRALAEDLYAPYDNDYASQLASGAYVESLEVFATELAARALGDEAQRRMLLPCTPTGPSDTACFERVVSQLIPRAMRRPLIDGEVELYLPLLELARDPAAPTGGFDMAVALLIRSLVQDPEFLYRIEAGDDSGVLELSDHELAVRMSYLLWGTTPDDALRARAERGELRDPTTRREAAAGMLDDPRAREQLHRFHAMWLGYRAIPQQPELASAFARETNALLDRVIFDEPQSYLRAFDFDETYLDDALADHYGLPRPSGGRGWVAYDEATGAGAGGRAGILSHGSVLAAFGKFSDTSPTQRGIFVRTRLMCQELAPPPPNVVADKPPTGDRDAVCKFDRYSQHRESSSCANCHSLTDAIGFGLENFDLAGRYRSHDDGLTECSIDGEGTIVGIGDFRGPKELGALLIEHELLEPCIVQQYLQFALGHAPGANEQPAIRELSARFADTGHLLRELILEYVTSAPFARRTEPEAP